MAAMRSPEIATEAGAWTSSSPRSRPRNGPVPLGETAASRSWTRSETSAIFFLPVVDAASGDPRRRHDPAPGPEEKGGGEIPGLHVCGRRVFEVYLDEVGGVAGSYTFPSPSRLEQPGGRRVFPLRYQDVPPAREPAGARLYLPELLERVDPHVRVGADAEVYLQRDYLFRRQKAVAQVPLRGRAGAYKRAVVGEETQLGPVGVGGMDDHGAGAEKAGLGQEPNRAHPVLSLALLDLARLLAGVDVEGQLVAVGVNAYLLQPPSRHGPDAVSGDPDLEERSPLLRPPPERLHPFQETPYLRVPKTGDAAPGVADREENEPYARFLCGHRCRFSERVRVLVGLPIRAVVDVVELGDARVAAREHLAVAVPAHLADGAGIEALRQGVHPLSPGPEIVMG